MKQKIIISKCLKNEISTAIENCEHDRIFILVDEITEKNCLPIIRNLNIPYLKDVKVITIGASDNHKDLDSLSHVWKSLCDNGATRHSCLLNIGGGMVTDLGGFAASTFKRGINFINIPTTLLAMVDASVGGKTGINFNGLKNEIGVFNDAKTVIINTEFLK
ncbi:MAG: 3-dehydroquinate synthase, partial [Prevotella sp.]|nr:3-dehydroquinate synthase [Prevotella sp.]